MFKGFSDSSRNQEFHGFPNLNFQMNNEAYGFSGCTFWLDAAYGLNTQTDLAAVSSWEERILGMRFVQATAGAQPRLVVSEASFNNLPCIDFYSNSRFMQSFNGLVNISKNFTVGVVYQVTSISAGANLLFDSTLLANSKTIMLAGNNSSVTGLGIYPQISTAEMATNIEDLLSHIGVLTDDEILVDGVQEITGSASFNTSFDLLGASGNTSRRIQGKIAEIIVFNTKLNSSQCIALSDRLNSKYAIY
jgi:hypothetical protein